MFNFQNTYALILIPFLIILFFYKRNKNALIIPGIEPFKKIATKSKKYLIGKFLIFSSLILMSIALARPQLIKENSLVKRNGIDIVIALDLSQSMLQEDFYPNRLEEAKKLLNKFINERKDDRISLVVFGGDAYTKVPLTFDHNMLQEITSKITTDDITSNDRTAIGMGLGIAINRLKNSEAHSKVIILLTDGENNSGEMSPIDAAKIAKELGIKVYTIGIGAYEYSNGLFKVPNNEIDENLLNIIAKETGGEYFRASNEKEFENIFAKINNLEKTKIEDRSYYEKTELYQYFLMSALFALLVGTFFDFIKYIRLP